MCAGLRQSLALADDAGIDAERILVDPGLGFGKTQAHNLELVRRLGELRSLDRPLLVGPLRTSTIGALLDGTRRTGGSRAASLSVLAAANGADLVHHPA